MGESPTFRNKYEHTVTFKYLLTGCLMTITFISVWLVRADMSDGRSSAHVWWHGWLTALSTGLGALPVALFTRVSEWWMGAANALAAGMMCAASFALLREGVTIPGMTVMSLIPAQSGLLLGCATGAAFVALTPVLLHQSGEVHSHIIEGVNARKALLIVAVMVVHSFSEGIAIGVSFRHSSPPQLGWLVTCSLAIHNVPEGLAVSVPLMAQGVSTLSAALWSIGTSIPQPITALIAFHYVDTFELIQPLGFGFAAGAMLWVAMVELLPDSWDKIGYLASAIIGLLSGVFMFLSHEHLF